MIEKLFDEAERLLAAGRADDAMPVYERGLALAPQHSGLHCGLADALHDRHRLADAIPIYRQAVALNPNLARASWGLGCALLELGHSAEAATSLSRVVSLNPTSAEAHHNLGRALCEMGQVDPGLDAMHRASAMMSGSDLILGAIATMIPGSPRADNRAILEARRAWAAVGAPEPSPPGQCLRPTGGKGRPLRLGYVSSFFQDRNWMKPVWGLINQHDRDRFEIHLFSEAPESSLRHGYHKDPRDRLHDFSGQANTQVARRIEEEAIDILIDLNGYSRLGRLPLFALRPAPVLVAWFNSFATSGLRCFDYLIGDEHVFLPGEESYFTERVLRLPMCYLTFEVTYPVPDVAPAPCRSGTGLTFGCLAPQYKLTTEVIETWCRILQGSPGCRLVLKNRAFEVPANRGFVQDLFGRFGIGPERLELDGPDEHYTFLGKYAAMDLALDTFPYNGGTTTMEALWQGVPVLCFQGDRWAARISASLMRNAGLSEFVADNLEDHIRQAIELANDPQTPARLAQLRSTMRDRLRAAPVCDTATFARTMEQAYTVMWRQWVEGQ